jgi:hypothetical protein
MPVCRTATGKSNGPTGGSMAENTPLREPIRSPLIRTDDGESYTIADLPADVDLTGLGRAELAAHGIFVPLPKTEEKLTGKDIHVMGPSRLIPRGPGSGSTGPQPGLPRPQLGEGLAGAIMDRPVTSWTGASATLTAPYTKPPATWQQGQPLAELAAYTTVGPWEPWGWLQAGIFIESDQSGASPSPTCIVFSQYATAEEDPGGSSLPVTYGVPAPFSAGDVVTLFCAYVNLDIFPGAPPFFALSQFLLHSDMSLYTHAVPLSPAQFGPRASVGWVLENLAAGDEVLPAFSGSADGVTPLTFTQAVGYEILSPVDKPQAVSVGNEFTVEYETSNGVATGQVEVEVPVEAVVEITYKHS